MFSFCVFQFGLAQLFARVRSRGATIICSSSCFLKGIGRPPRTHMQYQIMIHTPYSPSAKGKGVGNTKLPDECTLGRNSSPVVFTCTCSVWWYLPIIKSKGEAPIFLGCSFSNMIASHYNHLSQPSRLGGSTPRRSLSFSRLLYYCSIIPAAWGWYRMWNFQAMSWALAQLCISFPVKWVPLSLAMLKSHP